MVKLCHDTIVWIALFAVVAFIKYNQLNLLHLHASYTFADPLVF